MPKYRVVWPQFSRPGGAGKRPGLRGLVRSEDKGFSLIEVIVSIGVFAIIAAFMSQTLATGMRGVLLGKRREIATQEANQVLEIARSLSYNAVGLLQTDPSIASDTEIEAHSGKLSYEVNSVWEPIIWATNPSGHPFNPHIQDLTRGSTKLRRHVYVTGVNTDGDATTFELKRVLVQVYWTGGGTAGPENSVRAQTLVNETGTPPTGGGTAPLTAKTFASGGSLKVASGLPALGLTTPLDIGLPNSRGDSTFRAVSTTNCTTKSASLSALNLVDLPGYTVTTTADDDSRTETPSNPSPQSASGLLNIPLGPIGDLIGPVINSPVACEAEADGLAHEQGSASALGVFSATDNVLALGGLLNWLLTLASVDGLPVTQSIDHEEVSGQREVAATTHAAFGMVNLLKIPGIIGDGVVRVDALDYRASVRGSAGTPSVAPTVTAPVINLRVFDNGNKLGSVCTSRSGSYCVVQVNPSAAGFNGLSFTVSHNFTQLLGLNIVNLIYSATIDILPPAKSGLNGVTGPNGEKRWSAEYTPLSISTSLDANILGIPLIDADVDLKLGTVRAEACAGATC